jgi:hypothetical protein
MYQQPYPNQQPILQNYQQQMPIQNGGTINVGSEQEAVNYLLAPGTIMFFKDVNSDCIYERSRPYSQFEPTTFKKYVRVNEEVKPKVIDENPAVNYVTFNDFSELLNEFKELKNEMKSLKDSMNYKRSQQWKPKEGQHNE